ARTAGVARILSASPCLRREARKAEAIRKRAAMVRRRAVCSAAGFGRHARGAGGGQSGIPGEIWARVLDLCQREIKRRDTEEPAKKFVDRSGRRIAQCRRRAAQDHAAALGETSRVMSEITTHVLDISIGRPAAGLAVVLEIEKTG